VSGSLAPRLLLAPSTIGLPGSCWMATFGINPSSMTDSDRQFRVHDGKIRSAFLELVIAVPSISEGLDTDVMSMVFGEL
jgi:hypothetical protein